MPRVSSWKAGGDFRAGDHPATAFPEARVRNVFLLYMPPSNHEAMVHYQDTIVNRVPLSRLTPFLPTNLTAKLRGIFGANPIAVWGSQPGTRNRSNYETMSQGDDILIVEGSTVKLMGKVAAKTINPRLARELWQHLDGAGDVTWELIYFIANPREIGVPFKEVGKLFGYEPTYQLRGFTTITAERLVDFYERYDDLYSILERLQSGTPIEERVAPAAGPAALAVPAAELVELQPDQIDEVLKDDLVSDHVRMQWKLARLGIKAGERVWVPAGDQQRLKKTYQFDSFDAEFAAGIDLPHSYVENIDVIWKQEFRIGAAYEIENSTSIYSGLLRFADLNILAPNTLYPMFVVAQANRKNQLRKQLHRPAFQRLGLEKKVRFLSYERIDEIEAFFGESDAGLTVDMMYAKSEQVA